MSSRTVISVLYLLLPISVLVVLRIFGESYIGNVLKLYPVLINLVMLFLFGASLFSPPTAVFKMALLSDSSIRTSVHYGTIENYCRNVTKVWCVFFILNASISLITFLYTPSWIWALYNGCIAYILMGILFAVEWLVRKKVQKGLK